MRVIAGENRGLKLSAVPGDNTRPTTDRVKESMFNIVGPYFDGGDVLDLFAGSGSLGIEALSRGANRAVFVDKSTAAITTIKKNLQFTKQTDKSKIFKTDWKLACDKLAQDKYKFSYVFLDPPYIEFQQTIAAIVTYLIEKCLLAEKAMIVCEHESHFQLDSVICGLISRQYKYGNTSLTVYYKEEI